MSMDQVAVTEVATAVVAGVSLIREVFRTRSRAIDRFVPGRAQKLGEQEKEAQSRDVDPVIDDQVVGGKRDQEGKEGIRGVVDHSLVEVVAREVIEPIKRESLRGPRDRSLQLLDGLLEAHVFRRGEQLKSRRGKDETKIGVSMSQLPQQ